MFAGSPKEAGAINLEALVAQLYNAKNLDKMFAGSPKEAGANAADKAFAIAVAANFVTGLFEILGCVFAEPIRAIIPPPAYYSLLTGVGFVYLAFAPMITIASEPILCLVPLLVVVCGFFGGVHVQHQRAALDLQPRGPALPR